MIIIYFFRNFLSIIALYQEGYYSFFTENKKTLSNLKAILDNQILSKRQAIHVFVAYDREGKRPKESILDLTGLRKKFCTPKRSKIKSIDEIVATQDLESWFFHDIDAIFKYLKVSKKKQNPAKYANVENHNNKSLAQLFQKNGKLYIKKGDKAEDLINHLDLDKIYNQSYDLQMGINKILDLTN